VLLAVAVLALWLATAAIIAWQAKGNLDAGRALAKQAQALPLEDITHGRSQPLLRRAGVELAAGAKKLDSPLFVPLRIVPVVGRQVRTTQRLASGARDASRAASAAVADALAVLDRPRPPGPERVKRIREIEGIATRFDRRLAVIRLGARGGLIGPIADAHDELTSQIARVRTGLAKAVAGTDALAGLLATPHTYLVMAGNNAEMRAGSGMFLSIGTLTTTDGRLQLGGMEPVEGLPAPAGVAVVGDMADRWGWLHPSEDFRNLMLSPRFPQSAQLATQMWRAIGRGDVDGVLVLDPVTLHAILAATGPVSSAGRTIDAANVVDELLHGQYLRYPTAALRTERREELGDLAGVTFARLDGGEWSPGRLAAGLGDAARGRHLMLWSREPKVQAAWAAAGLDGSIGPSTILVSALNRGGNKLDPFLSVDARLELHPVADHTEGRIVVTFQNGTPEGEPPYVQGPNPALPLAPGEYLGILTATLPGRASGGRIEGVDQLSVAGADGPTRVVGTEFRVVRNATQALAVRFSLPGRHGTLTVGASGRIQPIGWTYQGVRWTDTAPRTVHW
jgi:hypothetical protein